MTVGERLAAGPALFGEVSERMKLGIRMKHPDADDSEVARLLKEQVDQMTAWKEAGIYEPLVS